jgi:hypothetical protein
MEQKNRPKIGEHYLVKSKSGERLGEIDLIKIVEGEYEDDTEFFRGEAITKITLPDGVRDDGVSTYTQLYSEFDDLINDYHNDFLFNKVTPEKNPELFL